MDLEQRRKREEKGKRNIGNKLCFMVLFLFFVCTGKTVYAAEATLRIISTTDLHNQLSVEYYDNAGEKSKGSLAKVSTLIKEARASLVTGSSVTVDVGDTIYGYGSDYIYENDNDAVQPMYAAMKEIGYDAITLGNHDFDYGVPYIKKQIEKSGFYNICTVANVFDAVTKKRTWKNYIMVTKQCLATDGNSYPVDIAIIGVTRPALSNYSTHTGELTTEDMVEQTKEQAKLAKENGADVVLVIAHTGIGSENPEPFSENMGYALAGLSDVDAVMCGHLHENFPSTSNNSAKYYDLADVDEKTGLMRNKPVIMIQDRGRGIGVADLTLKIAKDGAVNVAGATSSKIVYCNKNTQEDPAILKYKSLFDEKIKNTYKESFVTLEDGENIQNYFGYLEDNAAIQLNNECKIREGLMFQAERDNAYKSYPIIAASNYKKTGSEGIDDYVTINGFLTMKDLLGIQTYNRDYLMIYRISGTQLKEWLEWIASIYGYWDNAASFSDTSMQSILSSRGLQSLQSSLWIEDWKNFTVFDGVEYEFNMSNAPKYNRYGEVMNASSSRVSKLTYNGQAVADDMQFLLVIERNLIYNNPVVGAEILNQRVKNTRTYFVNDLKDYVVELDKFGKLKPSCDNNWNVTMNAGDNYLIRSTINSKEVAKEKSWYKEILAETAEFVYYQAKFDGMAQADTSGPTLVIGSTNKIKTNRDIFIAVQATDKSGIASLQYAKGEYSAGDSIWNFGSAGTISGSGFSVTENGTYSVMARDTQGNATVKYITINNLDKTILQVPELESYTNKKSGISGYAEPLATVYVELGDVTYTTVVADTGTFFCELPHQDSGTKLSVYVMDDSGRRSDKVEVVTGHTGPNYPSVEGLDNKSKYITGQLNNESHCQIFAVIGTKVYVSKNGGKEAYIASTKYSTSKTIVETAYKETNGSFSLKVAVQNANKDVKVFAVDTIGRVSAVNNFKVEEVAPNKPTIYKVSDAEQVVYGKISSPVSGSAYTIDMQVDAQTYTYDMISDQNGYFEIPVENLQEGMEVSVTVSDTVEGQVRTSAKTTTEVVTCASYAGVYGYIDFDEVTDKTTALTGRILQSGYEKVFIKLNEQHYTLPLDENRQFRLDLEQQLTPGTKIYAVLRENQGKLTDTAIISVEKAPALQPTVLTAFIYNTTKTVQIVSEEDCTAYVKIGDQTFICDTPKEDEFYGGYVYNVKVKNISAREDIVIYMLNDAGKSKQVFGTVKGKKPEIRSLKKITYKQKKLEGRVGLYLSPDSEAKNVTAKTTNTKVYAKTGGKQYVGTVKKDGRFKIKFPAKMKSGKKIKVWAVNDFGGKGKVVITTVK